MLGGGVLLTPAGDIPGLRSAASLSLGGGCGNRGGNASASPTWQMRQRSLSAAATCPPSLYAQTYSHMPIHHSSYNPSRPQHGPQTPPHAHNPQHAGGQGAHTTHAYSSTPPPPSLPGLLGDTPGGGAAMPLSSSSSSLYYAPLSLSAPNSPIPSLRPTSDHCPINGQGVVGPAAQPPHNTTTSSVSQNVSSKMPQAAPEMAQNGHPQQHITSPYLMPSPAQPPASAAPLASSVSPALGPSINSSSPTPSTPPALVPPYRLNVPTAQSSNGGFLTQQQQIQQLAHVSAPLRSVAAQASPPPPVFPPQYVNNNHQKTPTPPPPPAPPRNPSPVPYSHSAPLSMLRSFSAAQAPIAEGNPNFGLPQFPRTSSVATTATAPSCSSSNTSPIPPHTPSTLLVHQGSWDTMTMASDVTATPFTPFTMSSLGPDFPETPTTSASLWARRRRAVQEQPALDAAVALEAPAAPSSPLQTMEAELAILQTNALVVLRPSTPQLGR